ncbi:MAG TPA: polymer-forming cytoskeletal protein [Solirubrobacterales bacterium]|nr:polymer-forming cytoskeletal protein [Solirubrobacterales bacterium]
MRRIWLPAALIALCLSALSGTAAAAPANGHEKDAIVVISGDVNVPRWETVEGIVVASGDVRVEGRVDGDVVLFAGDATVSGRIDGDLVTFGGRARLLPSAFVTGDLQYADERPIIAPQATVRGDVLEQDWDDSLELLPFIGAFVLWLGVTISMAILGLLLLLIAPRAADAISARSRERAGIVIAIGIAVAICLPLAAGIAAVTLVGIPLAVVLGLALLPAAALAYVAAAYALGRRIVSPPQNRVWSFLAGLAILRVAALVPFLGLLVGLAAVVIGFGLIAAAIGAAREPEAEAAPAQIPGS